MCLKWLITGYTTGRLWLITSGQLSIYVIIYIDHVVQIDFSEIWLHSGALLMWAEEGDRVGSGLIRRMDASPHHMDGGWGRERHRNARFLPTLRGHHPRCPPAQFDGVFCFLCAISSVFPRRPPLCSSFNGSASGTATSPPHPLPLGPHHHSTV